MKNTLETRLGIFVALAVIAAFLILEIVGGIDLMRSGYRLHALFENAQELKQGDPVKMAGVKIGAVESVALTEGKVRVSMKLDRSASVKTDSVAAIRFTGLMGQNFVALTFGSPGAPQATDGAILASTEQADLGTLMAKIDSVATGVENLTKSFTGDKIDNLLGPFTDFLKQNGPNLTAFFGNVRSISDKISSGEGTVGRLIHEDDLYVSALGAVTNLQEAGAEMRLTLSEARQVVDQINAGRGTLGKLATDETLYNETTTSMTNLKEILQKINRGEGTVGRLVNEDTFYKNARMTLQKIDKAAEGLEDQGPLSVLGIAVSGLF